MKRHALFFRELMLAFACALKEEKLVLLKHFIMMLLQECYLKMCGIQPCVVYKTNTVYLGVIEPIIKLSILKM